MTSTKFDRDYLFDNYKVLLIFLVVAGHFIEPSYDNNLFLYSLKWIIVSFHMPAFIFVSGYFSKRKLPFKVLFQKLAVPYLVYEVIYFLFYTFILQKETGLYLHRPKFSLWYLLALFVWRAITPYVKKIPHHVALSVAAGLLIGCSNIPGNYLSIPRILVFYPFFLAGIHFDRSLLTKLKTPRNCLTAVITLCISLFIALVPLTMLYSTKIFYGRYNYDYLGQGMIEGIFCRIVCYLIGMIFTYTLLFLIPERKLCVSYIGTRTMAIYLFHGLTYNYLKDCTRVLQGINTFSETLFLLMLCISLTVLFSSESLTVFTNKISNLHFSRLCLHIPAYMYEPKLGYI